ncbi:hypothetical protein J7643_19110 [bacterium]|nr:hypothetical protein [bacterium]
MGEYAKNQSLRGTDVAIRLYRQGQVLDIIEAEEIEGGPNLVVIESAPLSVGHTQRDTHVDGYSVTVKAVRKGHALLDEVLAQCKANASTGKALPKYTVLIAYRDTNTNVIRQVKVVNATLTEVNPFASGTINAKQTEGFKLMGQLG